MAMTGKNDKSKWTTTRRVRNFEPATPAAFGIELQQIAPQHQRQSDKRKEDHPRQRGEKEELLIAIGVMNFS